MAIIPSNFSDCELTLIRHTLGLHETSATTNFVVIGFVVVTMCSVSISFFVSPLQEVYQRPPWFRFPVTTRELLACIAPASHADLQASD